MIMRRSPRVLDPSSAYPLTPSVGPHEQGCRHGNRRCHRYEPRVHDEPPTCTTNGQGPAIRRARLFLAECASFAWAYPDCRMQITGRLGRVRAITLRRLLGASPVPHGTARKYRNLASPFRGKSGIVPQATQKCPTSWASIATITSGNPSRRPNSCMNDTVQYPQMRAVDRTNQSCIAITVGPHRCDILSAWVRFSVAVGGAVAPAATA
jgi:hypothetical protein